MMDQALDNPIWSSLETDHSHLVMGGNEAKRYPADVAPFAGILADTQAARDELASLLTDGPVYLLGRLPTNDTRWIIEQRATVLQMTCSSLSQPTTAAVEFRELGEVDAPAMLELTALVFPGYFRKRTPVMGRYLGTFAAGVLIAMAGERMALRGHCELSAICTRPGFTGRGYASTLVIALVAAMMARNVVPFLHVSPENTRARGLYRSLGFIERTELPLIRIRAP